MLHATTACTFSTSEPPKVARTCGVLYIFTSKCASRQNGVQLFISHLARCLRTRPPRSHKSLEKHSVSRLSYLFAHLHLRSSYSFSSTLLSSNLSLLSASALLCFSSVHIVGSLTSRLPSMIDIFSSIFRRMISFIIYMTIFFFVSICYLCVIYILSTRPTCCIMVSMFLLWQMVFCTTQGGDWSSEAASHN